MVASRFPGDFSITFNPKFLMLCIYTKRPSFVPFAVMHNQLDNLSFPTLKPQCTNVIRLRRFFP